jgi:hypothetical protein
MYKVHKTSYLNIEIMPSRCFFESLNDCQLKIEFIGKIDLTDITAK